MDKELSNKQIRDRILTAIVHTAPEDLHTLPQKIEGYMEILSDRIIDCPEGCDTRGVVFRCDSCMEASAILRNTRAAIEPYVK